MNADRLTPASLLGGGNGEVFIMCEQWMNVLLTDTPTVLAEYNNTTEYTSCGHGICYEQRMNADRLTPASLLGGGNGEVFIMCEQWMAH